ncbi:MAG: NUDIX hydrolase [Actinomycetaceae bacterium]|nr:NUDIX hydrolase [Actinomycetaceae bacterium]
MTTHHKCHSLGTTQIADSGTELPVVDTVTDESFEVTIHNSTTPWRGRVFEMRTDSITLPGSTQVLTRDYVKHPGAVAIVALRQGSDGHDDICLVSQYRHPVRKMLWEVPAGLLDVSGESYVQAAQRELKEEADLEAKTWHVLLDFYTTPGGCNEGLRVFLARDITTVPPEQRHQREEEEKDMKAVWIHLEDAYQAVCEGRLHNPSAIVGILSTMAARERNWQTLRPADAPWQR